MGVVKKTRRQTWWVCKQLQVPTLEEEEEGPAAEFLPTTHAVSRVVKEPFSWLRAMRRTELIRRRKRELLILRLNQELPCPQSIEGGVPVFLLRASRVHRGSGFALSGGVKNSDFLWALAVRLVVGTSVLMRALPDALIPC